ncbi:hypothetical protein AB4Z38_13715 [Arthrobacter sp. 2RAF6]|uniref:hypothetical protein n=1 Tax=Arthrobacter sp. 2RAF6 TaxID=3233002 RepID=UPI003F90C5F9
MREWVRRHPKLAVALALVLAWVVVMAVLLAFGRPLVEVIAESVFWAIIYGALSVFELRRIRRTKVRLEENGQVRAYLRYPNSRPGSLDGIWNMGIATPSAGLIHFQPAVYDTLEPSGRPTTIKVLQFLPDRRPISRKERKYVTGFGIQAMSLVTEEGDVEIAASPESPVKLLDTVEGH